MDFKQMAPSATLPLWHSLSLFPNLSAVALLLLLVLFLGFFWPGAKPRSVLFCGLILSRCLHTTTLCCHQPLCVCGLVWGSPYFGLGILTWPKDPPAACRMPPAARRLPVGGATFSPGRWHNLAATAWKMTETRETTAGAPLLWVRI